MTSTAIDQAFISAFIDADFELDIAHENINFEPTAGTEYVELTNFPNDITPLSINGALETDGLMRAILYWPENKGSTQAKLKADEIMAVFSMGARVCYDNQCATVKRLERRKGVNEKGWYKIVVTIGYTAFIER